MTNIIGRIQEFNKTRDPGKVSLKYTAMGKNLFRFFRGTAHIYWEDLAAARLSLTSPLVWGCGDLHLENFGSYKSDNGLVYFDLNDFDDAALMPLHWEIARMLTSIYVAFKSLKIDQKKADKLAMMFVKSYKEFLGSGKALYIERQIAQGIVREFLEQVETRKYKELVEKKTHRPKSDNEILIDGKRHLALEKDFGIKLKKHMQAWLKEDERSPYNYKVIDAAFRVAGTGSLGLERYILLLKSSNENGVKYLLVEMKEAAPSAAVPFLGIEQPARSNEAERVIELQKQMQNVSPALLSHVHFENKDFIVEEMQPEKDSINFKLLKGRYRDMCRVIIDMARLTAAAQIRSAGRRGSTGIDELIAFSENNELEKSLIEYALEAATQTELYFQAFCRHIHTGETIIRA